MKLTNLIISVLLLACHQTHAQPGPELQWQTLAPMPVAVQEIYPTVHKDHIYVAGGLSDALPEAAQQMTAAVQVYNPEQNSWRLAAALPEPRHGLGAVSLNNQVYVLGGAAVVGLKATSAVLESVTLQH